MINWREHILADPEIMYGKPCIKGTRIPVDLILDKLAAGQPIEDILKGYPQLTNRTFRRAFSMRRMRCRRDPEP
jgi:uncharacterized protein (DUF433 family)